MCLKEDVTNNLRQSKGMKVSNNGGHKEREMQEGLKKYDKN